MPTPIATGSFRRTSGKRLGCRPADGLLGVAVVVSCVPQTRQRVADSESRVPQTGQIFEVFSVFSGVIFFMIGWLVYPAEGNPASRYIYSSVYPGLVK